MEMAVGKSWKVKKCQMVIEFCVKSLNITNFAPKFRITYTFFHLFLKNKDRKHQSRESEFSDSFHIMLQMPNLSRGMVMQNQDIVMEKSSIRSFLLQSLSEPCTCMNLNVVRLRTKSIANNDQLSLRWGRLPILPASRRPDWEETQYPSCGT